MKCANLPHNKGPHVGRSAVLKICNYLPDVLSTSWGLI